MDQITSYLEKRNMTVPDPKLFEIIYHGSLDALEGIPEGTVAVVRSRQIWQTQNGKPGRIYTFLDGHGQQVGSDDNFKSYEALHVISGDQSGH